MHWTAFLAYRRFPAHARVADDLSCIGCGYNLRGMIANGRCPECGDDVGKSLYVLAKPEIVARDLRMAAKGYFAVLALLLAAFAPWAGWTLIVATGIVTVGSAWRAIGLVELRSRGAIVRLPGIGMRLRWFVTIAVLECIVSIVLCGLTYWFIKTGTPLLNWMMVFPAWLALLFACTAVAGWFGHSMTTMLGYGWMSIEFRVQQVINVVAAIVAFSALFMTAVTTSFALGLTMFILFMLAIFIAVGSTGIALLHLANAAEQETEPWEDAIDTERPEVASPPPSARNSPDSSAIKLEP